MFWPIGGALGVEAASHWTCACGSASTEEQNCPDSPHLNACCPGEEDEVTDMPVTCHRRVFFCISEASSLWDGSL